jgi:AhpD family alkylhydroperoxidase
MQEEESAALTDLGMQDGPRIAPGTRHEIGTLNFMIARAVGLVMGSPPPNVFTTLARHRRLFRPWLRFAGALMPRGELPRADTELVILRVAANCGCDYEWRHHQRLAEREGLSNAELTHIKDGPTVGSWTQRQSALLRAADELHDRRNISQPLWDQLRPHLTEVELIELCLLVGHYEMLAMTINSLEVQPDVPAAGGPPRLGRWLGAAAGRRRRRVSERGAA